jgi:hypothetical protein
MSFVTQTFRILIASPSDLVEESRVATEAVNDWNAQHSYSESIVLLPVRWETHGRPEAGVRPGAALNKQLVETSDMLIGMFWTTIGTNTGATESRTVEEINHFVAAGKPALLYFSNRPIGPDQIDLVQRARLHDFKEEILSKALVAHFSTPEELREQILRNLTDQVREIKKRATPDSSELETIVSIFNAHQERINVPPNLYSGGGAQDVRSMNICTTIYKSKFEELCHQYRGLDFYMRRDRFKALWDLLTRNVKYQSVCDLSSYSRLRLAAPDKFFNNFYDSLAESWEDRIGEELAILRSYAGTFQKIIVYSPPAKLADPERLPPCHETEDSRCDYLRCGEDRCVVKHVVKMWVDAAPKLKEKRPPTVDGAEDNSIWLIHKEKIQDRMMNLNLQRQADSEPALSSVDIGIFGNNFIGEEFKVPIENHRQHLMKDYLIRVRHDQKLVRQVSRVFDRTIMEDAVALA